MLLLGALDPLELQSLLGRHGLRVIHVAGHQAIPGSYWGPPEAGLVGAELHARCDTPVHSILHEGAHFICMTPRRRAGLDTDAGGDDAEEAAVCYLQILLADSLSGIGRPRLCADMDDWGYSFRLGSAAAWFAEDAQDARRWLMDQHVIDDHDRVLDVRR